MQNPERRQEEAIDQRQKEGPGGKWRKPKERMLSIKRVAWATESAMPEKRGVGAVVSREAVSGDLSKTFFFSPHFGSASRKREKPRAGIPRSQRCHIVCKLLNGIAHISSLEKPKSTFSHPYPPTCSHASMRACFTSVLSYTACGRAET